MNNNFLVWIVLLSVLAILGLMIYLVVEKVKKVEGFGKTPSARTKPTSCKWYIKGDNFPAHGSADWNNICGYTRENTSMSELLGALSNSPCGSSYNPSTVPTICYREQNQSSEPSNCTDVGGSCQMNDGFYGECQRPGPDTTLGAGDATQAIACCPTKGPTPVLMYPPFSGPVFCPPS